jgi:hypothetical protein
VIEAPAGVREALALDSQFWMFGRASHKTRRASADGIVALARFLSGAFSPVPYEKALKQASYLKMDGSDKQEGESS